MKGTVLLVDDERDTLEMLALAVERAGYRCLTAADGRGALAQVASAGPVDVVVTDVVLGRDDRAGLKLMMDLRGAGVRAPVVIITAHADVEMVKIALNQGAAQLLEKPFRAPELLAAVDHVREAGTGADRNIDRILADAHLTEKERTVARSLLEGLSSSEIAELAGNSPKTIRQHVSQIYAKFGVGSRAEFFRLVYSK
jgi:DNA-binding NarL/FixJ family response regulator